MHEAWEPPIEQARDLIEQRLAGVEPYEILPIVNAARVQLSRRVTRERSPGQWCQAELADFLTKQYASELTVDRYTCLTLHEPSPHGDIQTAFTLEDDGQLYKNMAVDEVDLPKAHRKHLAMEAIIGAAQEGKSGLDKTTPEDWRQFLGNLSVGEWTPYVDPIR